MNGMNPDYSIEELAREHWKSPGAASTLIDARPSGRVGVRIFNYKRSSAAASSRAGAPTAVLGFGSICVMLDIAAARTGSIV